jgi:hypothetical protein
MVRNIYNNNRLKVDRVERFFIASFLSVKLPSADVNLRSCYAVTGNYVSLDS